MDYYKLAFDCWHLENIIYCNAEKKYGLNSYDMDLGSIITQWNDDVTFWFDLSDGTILTDYLANTYSWFIVSDRFRNIMAPLVQDSIQYLPLKVHNRDTGEIITSYQAANVVSVVEALDMDYSDYDICKYDDNEEYLDIRKYAIKGTKTEGKHIFKLKGETIPTIVSEAFKNRIHDNKLTGFYFIDVWDTDQNQFPTKLNSI